MKKIIIILLLLCIIALSSYFLINQFGISRRDTFITQESVHSEDKHEKKLSTQGTGPNKKKDTSDDTNRWNYQQKKIQKEYLRTIVYYFHNTARDATCRNIELLTSQSLYYYFGDKLASGKLTWKVINLENPWNKHFIDDFKVNKRSIVIIVPSAYRPIRWKVLNNTENLIKERGRFFKYIKNEVSAFLL